MIGHQGEQAEESSSNVSYPVAANKQSGWNFNQSQYSIILSALKSCFQVMKTMAICRLPANIKVLVEAIGHRVQIGVLIDGINNSLNMKNTFMYNLFFQIKVLLLIVSTLFASKAV